MDAAPKNDEAKEHHWHPIQNALLEKERVRVPAGQETDENQDPARDLASPVGVFQGLLPGCFGLILWSRIS